jgi:hypothetical protein
LLCIDNQGQQHGVPAIRVWARTWSRFDAIADHRALSRSAVMLSAPFAVFWNPLCAASTGHYCSQGRGGLISIAAKR